MRQFQNTGINAGHALAIIILFLAGMLSYRSTKGLIENGGRAGHSAEVIDGLHELLEAILYTESATRGYAAAGGENFLAHYTRAAARVGAAQRRLEQLLAGDPDQTKRLAELAVLIDNKLAFTREAVNIRREQGLEPVLRLLASARGQQLTDDIRSRIEAMDARERAILAKGTEQAEAGAARSIQALWAGKIFASALLLFIYYHLIRQIECRKRVQSELEQQTRILKSILDNMADAVVVADRSGKLAMFNPAAERMFGPLRASQEPEKWPVAYHLYLMDGITPFPVERLPVLRCVHGESAVDEEMIVKPPDAPAMRVRVIGRPLVDGSGQNRGAVVVCSDVTQLRLAHESEVRKLNRELEERVIELTVLNNELDAFTYSVSHDLRAPLRQMDGFSRILQEEATELSAESRHYLDRIRQGSAKMGRMVDELLKLARLGRQEVKKERVDLNAVVQEVLADLQAEANGREIEWRLGKLPVALCDPILIKSVFANLLSNAVKFTRNRPRAVIQVDQACEQDRAVIVVRDNGAGFNMKYSEKLFGVFQRLHRQEEFEGTGVGLATVHRILRKHGGDIWAEAEPDKGAAFYFTLQARQPRDRDTSLEVSHGG